jgi:hypothetical protein
MFTPGVRTISVHPGTRQHIATTSSFNKVVAIWDLCKVSYKRPMAGKVSNIDFNKPLSSAFSPHYGQVHLDHFFSYAEVVGF